MALTVNTNLGSMIVQTSLQDATKALNKALQQAKLPDAIKEIAALNKPKTDEKVNTQLNAISVAQDNIAIGSSMLATTDSNLDIISTQLNRIKTFTEDVESGKVSADSVKEKIAQAWDAIDVIAKGTEFNGTKLLDGNDEEVNLQIGTDSSDSSKITIGEEIFADSTAAALAGVNKEEFMSYFTDSNKDFSEIQKKLDSALSTISTRKENISTLQSKFDTTADSLDVRYANITSSMSTIKDADVAASSADNIKVEILKQAAASLSSTANQTPSVAINLI